MTQIRPRAAVLATIGTVAVAASAYFDWMGNRSPVSEPLQELLLQPDTADTASSYWMSMAAPLVVVGAVGLVGALLLSRVVLWLALLLGLATVALWATGVVSDAAPGELTVADVQPGAWISAGGLLLLLLGAAALRRRSSEDEDELDEDDDFATAPLTRQSVADEGP